MRASSRNRNSQVIAFIASNGHRNITVVADDFKQPNGLCFSHDEKRLFIIDSELQTIRQFDVDIDAGKLSNGKLSAEK
jgi:gluconolactonase